MTETEQRPKKLLDQVRDAIRLKHYSIRTEEAYVNWIRRYISTTNAIPPRWATPNAACRFDRNAAKNRVAPRYSVDEALSKPDRRGENFSEVPGGEGRNQGEKSGDRRGTAADRMQRKPAGSGARVRTSVLGSKGQRPAARRPPNRQRGWASNPQPSG